MRKLSFIFLFFFLTELNANSHEIKPMEKIGPGSYNPLYPSSPSEKEISVNAFRLDPLLVTNQQFLNFVQKNEKWRRDAVAPLFADESYLSHWKGPLELGNKIDPQQPVTYVSWFAAKAYCQSRQARLPRESEWELAAKASETKPDARSDSAWQERILAWYSQPAGRNKLARVGGSPPNYWKIYDLHQLVWEWVLDFNANMASVDNREQGGSEPLRFCGVGALKALDKSRYVDFMRIAFRDSLSARYTISHLGFRCAAGIGETLSHEDKNKTN
jgi:formylglycine-generating enzyme required for sulfatase activity